MIGVPSLLLRTTGRRSGRVRTSALVYARDGDQLVLVASNAGADHPPGWYLNLRDKPAVEVQIGRQRSSWSAQALEPGDQDYERLWRLVNENNHGRYDRYQAGTSRPIPLVLLTRQPAGSAAR